jgi:hypothetical protein
MASLFRADSEAGAVLWGIACCWLVVGVNFLLLELGVTIFYIVPIDLFAIPLAVTGLFHLLGRLA